MCGRMRTQCSGLRRGGRMHRSKLTVRQDHKPDHICFVLKITFLFDTYFISSPGTQITIFVSPIRLKSLGLVVPSDAHYWPYTIRRLEVLYWLINFNPLLCIPPFFMAWSFWEISYILKRKIVSQAFLNDTVPRGSIFLKKKIRDSTKFGELSKFSKSEISVKELQSEGLNLASLLNNFLSDM